jgi:hypothetical protein
MLCTRFEQNDYEIPMSKKFTRNIMGMDAHKIIKQMGKMIQCNGRKLKILKKWLSMIQN